MQDRVVISVPHVIKVRQVPAPLLFVTGGVSMYLGAAAAVWLFADVSPASVAWLRQLGAAAVLLAWRRPGKHAWRGRTFWLAALFGLVTAVMNIVFYEAVARLPLGTAVALEFVGPVLVAAFGSRTRRDVGALLLVVCGVLLIVDVQWSGSTLGVLFALAAALLWAGYIVLGKRVSDTGLGVDGLAVGFAVATVVLSPLAFGTGPVWGSSKLLLMGVGVGVLSTAIPYALDQVVLRRLGQASFALLLALLPVTATLIGLVVLRQIPSILEAFGITAVAAGLTLRSREPRVRTEPL
jgi:inner membrane transporter RhtA